MFNSLDISTSALIAQRTRMDAISGNIANLSTTRNEAGESAPYQPRFVIFKTDEQMKTPDGAMGVRVDAVEIAAEGADLATSARPSRRPARRAAQRLRRLSRIST